MESRLGVQEARAHLRPHCGCAWRPQRGKRPSGRALGPDSARASVPLEDPGHEVMYAQGPLLSSMTQTP